MTTIFGYSPPAQRHSDTSVAAAEAIKPKAASLREQVYQHILKKSDWDGVTDEEISENLEISGNTIRPRRVELVAEGRVVDSGMRRKTRSGRMAAVWVVKSDESVDCPDYDYELGRYVHVAGCDCVARDW